MLGVWDEKGFHARTNSGDHAWIGGWRLFVCLFLGVGKVGTWGKSGKGKEYGSIYNLLTIATI